MNVRTRPTYLLRTIVPTVALRSYGLLVRYQQLCAHRVSYVSALPLRSGVPAEQLKALAENHRWRQIYTQESVNSCLSKVHTVAYNEKNVSSVPRFIFLERFRFAHNLVVARWLGLERIGYIYPLDASWMTAGLRYSS